MSQTANRVYRSAKVYSVALDGTEIHAQALAIKDGKFVYVGDEAGVEAWIGDSTETIDCNGKSVIPGLGDAHQHNAQAAMKLGTYSFSHIVPNPMTDTPESVQEADGSPSGYISEPAVFRPIIDRIPNYEFSAKEHRDCQKKAFELFNKDGYTLLCDCQQAESAYEVLSEMAKNGEFTARVSGVHNVNDATRETDLEKAVKNRTKFDVGDLFVVDTVKYFADGSLSMIEPYAESSVNHTPGTREPLLWDEKHMKESMVLANKEGFNIHTHAMGSYAIRTVIDCYENAQKLYPNPKIRNIIAHDTFIAPEDRIRMGRSHIIASNQPGWFSDCPASQPVMVADWGEDVVRQTYPSKSLIDNGVMCAYGSDFPVNPAYGLAGIQVAMTRKNVKIDPDYELYKDVPAAMPEECVSLKEALQAHTIHVAYQAHLEDVTGSIEVGKSAELAVLDNDIETTPVEEIQDIKVLETVFMGKTVFKSL